MPNDIPNSTWNEADASNTAPVPNGAPEGWFPSDVNNVYRMGMGATKRFWDHVNFTETTTGTSTAYALTYAVAPQAYYDGEIYSFIVGVTCGTAPTLNVNALGAKSVRKSVGSTWVALAASDWLINQRVSVSYNLADDTFDMIFRSDTNFPSLSNSNTWTGTQTFDNTATMQTAAFNEAVRVDVASATTCDIGAALANYVRITGTTTITGLGTIASGVRRKVVFSGILTLTHNGTSLILPTGANITTAAGDCAEFESEGSGNWRCTDYQRADGKALAFANSSISANGYQAFPSGLIQQWGVSGSVGTGATVGVTFPTAFTTACYGVWLQATTGPGAGDNMPYPSPVSTTGFTINNRLSYTTTFYWWAVGK